MSRFLAVDPGSNKLGLAFFISGCLIATKTLISTEITPLKRRLDMVDKLSVFVETVDKVASEEPFLQGQNNTGMQRLLGGIELLTNGNVQFVHPMTLKKFTGSGSSDKLDMALAIGERLTEKEQEILADAINREAWDETDAVAVGMWALSNVL